MSPPQTSGFAIASLVLGVVWLGGIGAVLAIIFGYLGRNEIDSSNGKMSGRGMATAGIVLGFVGTAGIIFLIAAITLLGNNAATKFSTVANSIN